MLRKIMRRAMRNVRMIGVEEPFLYKLTGAVAELMKPAYPELMESVQRIARIVKDEEHRYATTFLVAERMFNDEVKSLAGQVIPGALLSSCTIPSVWRSTSRKTWRASAAWRSTARVSTAKWSGSASAPAPAGKAPRKAPSRPPIRNWSRRAARSSWATTNWLPHRA